LEVKFQKPGAKRVPFLCGEFLAEVYTSEVQMHDGLIERKEGHVAWPMSQHLDGVKQKMSSAFLFPGFFRMLTRLFSGFR